MSPTDLPFAPSCENNKDPILCVLRRHLLAAASNSLSSVLEIAGGTGQHAVYFAQNMPHLHWQSTDIPANVDSLNLRIAATQLSNLPLAKALDVTQSEWGFSAVDYIFTANSLHIMPWHAAQDFMHHAGGLLKPGGRLCVYGPFKYEGEFTTPSNEQFDLWLKSRDPASGVRDFEALVEIADGVELHFIEDNAMPANNQLLVWEKR